MRERWKYICGAAACIILLIACSKPRETSLFKPVNVYGWEYNDTLHYDIDVPDSIWHGDIAIVIRHTAAYPYSNIWLEINRNTADTTTVDTVNVRLADIYGTWKGSGLGLSFQCEDTIAYGATLITPASFSIRHIMRVDNLTDIEQVGLILLPDRPSK